MNPEDSSQNVVPLPVLQSGSIGDTLSGFARQIGGNGHLGHRVERPVSIVTIGTRGWHVAAERHGVEGATRLLATTLERLLEAMRGLGAADLSVSGTGTDPRITATFCDDSHALRSVVAAETAREAACRPVHPSIRERFHVSIGVNTGTLVAARVNGAGIEFESSGTTRMFANRLQEFAGPNQIFLSESTCRAVPTQLDVVPLGPVRTSGGGDTQLAYSLRGLARTEAR